MNIRNQRQQEAVQAHMEGTGKDIILAAPRFGKIRVALEILKRKKAKKVLLVFPRNDILVGWQNEMILMETIDIIMEHTTTRSLYKFKKETYDYIILDEIHEYSDKQLNEADHFVATTPTIALTGTATKKTLENIARRTGLNVGYQYTIQQAVAEGVLCNYSISVYYIPLDDKIVKFKTKNGKVYTEKKWFDVTRWLLSRNGADIFLNRMMHIIQGSISKIRKTRELLTRFKDDRVLVFCGLTEVADMLDIPVYHSENKDEATFRAFCNGEGDKMATIKMMQAGITIRPIHRGIINYTSGNPEDAAQKICRFLGMEYDNVDKKADLHILCSAEKFERIRMKTALLFFDNEKIKHYE